MRYCRLGCVLLKSNRNKILDVKASARMEAGGKRGRTQGLKEKCINQVPL